MLNMLAVVIIIIIMAILCVYCDWDILVSGFPKLMKGPEPGLDYLRTKYAMFYLPLRSHEFIVSTTMS